MLTLAGKTNLRALPSSVKLQPARFTGELLELDNSTKSGKVPPLATTPRLSASTSLKRTLGGGVAGLAAPGEPAGWTLARQFAGSSGSPLTSKISSERP